MKKIDLEHHFYDPSFIDAYTRRAEKKETPYYDRDSDSIYWSERTVHRMGGVLKYLLDLSEKRLALMDKWGIDLAVISSSPGLEQLPAGVAREVCRSTNDALHGFIQKHPDRLRGGAVLPVSDVPVACAELERCVRDYGFVSWQTHSNYGAKAPDQEEFRPIFRKCAELGVYVYLHPHYMLGDRLEGYGFGLAGAGLGFTVDTEITILRMILSGLFDEFPTLKVVLGHLGEALPFLLDRIDSRMAFTPKDVTKNRQNISTYFKNNIWVTTSGNMSKAAFQCTKDVLGMDHIALGTDYPYENYKEVMAFLENLALGRDEREMLYSKNATDFLNIKI